ncbi:HNH endonuclease [Cohnella yongneupensis]|uniref:HNH endonuclease n=1 Tax=Cohnella yongneupensis TaxID=425006 RepID=A0ABW0QX42_9BACL
MPTKPCAHCLQMRPLTEFKRRSGKRRGATSRRGACKSCREQRGFSPISIEAEESTAQEIVAISGVLVEESGEVEAALKPKRKRRRRRSKKSVTTEVAEPPVLVAAKPVVVVRPVMTPMLMRSLNQVGLMPTRQGFIRMRGKTDNGRRWYQEVDPELALTLVKEQAAVVMNRNTIRRLYSNKEFRRLILERDEYTCYFCKQYGDTIDHMLPRAKGGHTTPDNCVCACNLCNQSKADKDLEDFISILDLG